MKKKFKIGPNQEKWLQSLEKNGERQYEGALCKASDDGDYKACCLGEFYIVVNGGITSVLKEKGSFTHNNKLLVNDHCYVLNRVWDEYGLRSDAGDLHFPYYAEGEYFISLAGMNDGGMSWLQIATYIRENPENVFAKSF